MNKPELAGWVLMLLFTSLLFCNDLTSIAGLVHVNDLNLMTQTLIFPCHEAVPLKQAGNTSFKSCLTD